jgi:hypothetical protein
MINVNIRDPETGRGMRIGPEGEVQNSEHPHAPAVESDIGFPSTGYFTTDGDPNSSNFDMRQDGSSSNIEFYIKAPEDRDLYVVKCSFLISDAGASLNEFANLGSSLTNGFRLEYRTNNQGTEVIFDSLTTNWEFHYFFHCFHGFGDSASVFKISNLSGTADGYCPSVDFSELFQMRYGLKLRKGSTDKLVWVLRDNLSTGLDACNAIFSAKKGSKPRLAPN